MTKVIAVIGAGYGDEGKGLMTDYYSSQYTDAIVIRSNGGAQAGHTVVTPEGERHVFSHFGSGTFNGSPTFLSKHFVCNPILFVKEHKLLVDKFGIEPEIYVDGSSIITTPFDMLLNQTHEAGRGNGLHGSCGVGFGETLERQLLHDVINAADLSYFSDSDLTESLKTIRDEYVPTRIDLSTVDESFINIIDSDELISDFIEACNYMMGCVTLKQPHHLKDNTLIFEAAQGLLLDMDYGYFPHVTRSNCGMKNISNILLDIPGEHEVTVNYVRRAYTTRHGAGPLNGELTLGEIRHNIVDETNITNEFQGSLRFAHGDFNLFESVTSKDFLNYAPRGATKTTTMTCVDQLAMIVGARANNERHNLCDVYWKEDFMQIAERASDYLSYGPTREDVKELDK